MNKSWWNDDGGSGGAAPKPIGKWMKKKRVENARKAFHCTGTRQLLRSWNCPRRV